MAFFPCIYFCEANQRLFRFEDRIYEKMTHKEAVDYMIDRSKKRQLFFEVALKMFCLCDIRRKMLIVENPYHSNHFLCQYFPYRCSVIDTDRSMRGDFFHKPTQFWFINCKPTRCYSLEKNRNTKSVWKLRKAPSVGLCSEERSMISPDYARNFIADFILGRPLGGRPQQQDLFAQLERKEK